MLFIISGRDEDFVGFSAYMVGGKQSLKPDDFFPFEGVESNHGNHYDPKESEFICPTTGLYYFSVNLFSSGNNSLVNKFAIYSLGSNLLYCAILYSLTERQRLREHHF